MNMIVLDYYQHTINNYQQLTGYQHTINTLPTQWQLQYSAPIAGEATVSVFNLFPLKGNCFSSHSDGQFFYRSKGAAARRGCAARSARAAGRAAWAPICSTERLHTDLLTSIDCCRAPQHSCARCASARLCAACHAAPNIRVAGCATSRTCKTALAPRSGIS